MPPENAAREPLFDMEVVFEVDDYIYFYSKVLTEERTQAEVEALLEALEIDRPMKILDLACGFGRHANRLAALGHQVTGVDISPGFLEIARREAEELGVQVDYRRGDMRLLDEVGGFDRVLLLFTSFGYFEDQENRQVLENAARALNPGGLFGLDIPNRDMTLKYLTPYVVMEKEGDLMIDRNSFEGLTGCWRNDRIIIRDGVRKDKPFSIRLYNPTELRDMLAEVGLEVAKMLAGWQGEPFTSQERRMAVVARKPTG